MDPIGRAPVMVGVARGGSDSAVGFGAAESRRTGRPLDLVHVAPATGGWVRQLGVDSLRLAASRAHVVLGEDAAVRVELLEGSAVPELVHAAHGAALVVLERRAASDLRQLTPSTTAAVAGLVDAPLVSVPAGWLDEDYRIVTVGLDPVDPDERAVETAIRHARLRTATLRVVVSAEARPDGSGAAGRAALEDRLLRLGADACDVALEIAPGAAAEALVAASHGSDLLVLGRHWPLDPAGSRLGATAASVLSGAGCPVLMTSPAHAHPVGAARHSTDADRREPAHAPGHDDPAPVS